MDGGVLVGGVHLYWSRRGGVVLHTIASLLACTPDYYEGKS